MISLLEDHYGNIARVARSDGIGRDEDEENFSSEIRGLKLVRKTLKVRIGFFLLVLHVFVYRFFFLFSFFFYNT